MASKILFHLPSLGRAPAARYTIDSFKVASDADPDVDYWVTCEPREELVYTKHLDGQCSIQVAETPNKIAAFNAVPETAWDILVVASDDFMPAIHGWSQAIRHFEAAAREKPTDPVALWFSDGRQKIRCTIPVMNRAYYDLDGYVYHPSYGAYFCLPGESMIYMADHSFRRIDSIRPGESVIGSAKRKGPQARTNAGRQILTPATVTSVHSRMSTLIRITTASGRILRCTPDHVWGCSTDPRNHTKDRSGRITRRSDPSRAKDYKGKFFYDPAVVGMKLIRAAIMPADAPQDAESQRLLGWLGGMYDGEGCWPTISQHRDHNPETWEKIGATLTRFGFDFSRTDETYTIKGSRPEYLRFLNWTKPVRVHTKAVNDALLTGRYCQPDEIVDIQPESIFPSRVYCLTTETGNFIADGFISHNCDDEWTEVAKERGLREVSGSMFDHRHACFLGRPDDATYKRSRAHKDRDRKIYQVRKQFGFPRETPPLNPK